MKIAISKIMLVGRLIRNLFPSPVPMGVTDFHKWSDSIIEDYGFPKNDSVKFALATMVMHLGSTAAYKSKFFFALMVKAGAAKQVASHVFQEIKHQQIAKQKAEDAAAQVASDAQVPQA